MCKKHICRSAFVEKLQMTVKETTPWFKGLITQEHTSLEAHYGIVLSLLLQEG